MKRLLSDEAEKAKLLHSSGSSSSSLRSYGSRGDLVHGDPDKELANASISKKRKPSKKEHGWREVVCF